MLEPSMLCAFLVFLFQPEVGKAQKRAGGLTKGVENNEVDQDSTSRGNKEEMRRDQLLIHELKVMRIFCHTIQSRQTGVILYTYVKTTDAKIYCCDKCASYV